MKRRSFALLLLGVLVLGIAVPPAAAQVTVPITGTFTDAVGGTGTLAGTLTLQRFTVQNNQLFAVTRLTATLTDSLGNVLNVVRTIVLPVTVQSTCLILELTLGPLDLNLLGLLVHLDQVHLVIEADPAGGLLGQLLCAIANLLNQGGPLNAIADLLNQILRLLR